MYLSQARLHDRLLWVSTVKFLRQVFGVESSMDSFALHILETYKQVEFHKLQDPPKAFPQQGIVDSFEKEYAETLAAFAKEKHIILKCLGTNEEERPTES